MEMDNEPKKRVLVVGNGFDLAIGRNTRYSDFYQSEYCPKRYPAPLIAYLNEKLGDGKDVRWLDLETALQNYAIEANKNGNADTPYFTEEEQIVIQGVKGWYDPAYNDLYANKFNQIEADLRKREILYDDDFGITKVAFDISELEYTCEQRDRIALQKIKQGLSDFLNNMLYEQHKEDNLAFYLMKQALEDIQERTIVYSFNYTDISRVFTKDEYRADDFDERIHYVHGSLKTNNIIIGAKDGDYGKYNFLQKVFDKEYLSSNLLSDLLDAEEVDIYGHSLGECDSQYFESFFKTQIEPTAKKKSITIYTYNDKSREEVKGNLQKLTGNRLSYLYSKNEVIIMTDKEMKETLNLLRSGQVEYTNDKA